MREGHRSTQLLQVVQYHNSSPSAQLSDPPDWTSLISLRVFKAVNRPDGQHPAHTPHCWHRASPALSLPPHS